MLKNNNHSFVGRCGADGGNAAAQETNDVPPDKNDHNLLRPVPDNLLGDLSPDDSSCRSSTQPGFGDFTTRLKINLWGDDGGKTAFALLPYVKFPTSR